MPSQSIHFPKISWDMPQTLIPLTYFACKGTNVCWLLCFTQWYLLSISYTCHVNFGNSWQFYKCQEIYLKALCIPYSAKFWRMEILRDTDSSNIWRKIFWRMVIVFHHTPVNAVLFLNNLMVKIWRSSWKASKTSKFPHQNFCATRYLLSHSM